MKRSELEGRLGVILSRMSIHLPFIAAVAMSMPVKIEKCGTAETNGKWIKFDPDYADKLTDGELGFLYAHETLHKAFMHMWRRESRDPGLWNMAGDHVINLSLKAMGGTVIMPKGGLADPRFAGMSEEAVYEALVKEGAKAPAGYKPDIIEDGEKSQADAEIEIMNIAKGCELAGVSSSLMDKILDRASKPAVRWQDVLRSFVSSTVRSGSTWRRRNRRSEEIYLPSLRSKTLGSIVVFGDVSGSMVPLLQKITNEIQGIIDDVSPEFTHVICGDIRVTHVKTFERGDRISLSCKGGGGTDFRPLFDEVDKQGWEPDCAVFLTDTYGAFPTAPPTYPVIWGVLGAGGAKVHVPWGEVVYVKE